MRLKQMILHKTREIYVRITIFSKAIFSHWMFVYIPVMAAYDINKFVTRPIKLL